MSASKARKFYNALDLQQKRFVDDKTISTSISVKHWIAFLTKASLYDQYADKARSKSGCLIALAVLACIASVVAYFELELQWFVAVPVVFALVAYGLILRRQNLAKRDINNYLRSFFMPFLDLMRVKAGEDAKLSASLDFRNPTKVLKPILSTVRSRKLETFQPKYILAKVTLLDGAYLEIVIADDIKQYSYKSASGKHKSKVKTTHHYFIRLSAPKRVYKRKNQKLPTAVTVEETDDEIIFKLKGKHKDLGYLILSPKVFLLGLQSLYHQLEELNPTVPPLATATHVNQPISGASNRAASSDTGAADAIPYLLWSDTFFDRTDYDSLRDTGDIPLIVDEDSKLNIFES